MKSQRISPVGFVQSFNRCLLSTYYVPHIELHIGVSKTDMVLTSRILPLFRGDRHLMGNYQYVGCYHTDAL